MTGEIAAVKDLRVALKCQLCKSQQCNAITKNSLFSSGKY